MENINVFSGNIVLITAVSTVILGAAYLIDRFISGESAENKNETGGNQLI
jgi:hypothetical protein